MISTGKEKFTPRLDGGPGGGRLPLTWAVYFVLEPFINYFVRYSKLVNNSSMVLISFYCKTLRITHSHIFQGVFVEFIVSSNVLVSQPHHTTTVQRGNPTGRACSGICLCFALIVLCVSWIVILSIWYGLWMKSLQHFSGMWPQSFWTTRQRWEMYVSKLMICILG